MASRKNARVPHLASKRPQALSVPCLPQRQLAHVSGSEIRAYSAGTPVGGNTDAAPDSLTDVLGSRKRTVLVIMTNELIDRYVRREADLQPQLTLQLETAYE